MQRVLGIVDGPEHAVAVRVERGAVRLDEAAESILVAVARRTQQLLLGDA